MYGGIVAKLWRINTIFRLVSSKFTVRIRNSAVIILILQYYYRNPKIVNSKGGLRDIHLILIVLGLVLIDVILLILYTLLEGIIANFSGGTDVNEEKPSAVHGVSGPKLMNNHY